MLYTIKRQSGYYHVFCGAVSVYRHSMKKAAEEWKAENDIAPPDTKGE